MKVYFDYQIFYLQRYGGISRYFIELANALTENTLTKPKIIAPYYANHYIESVKNEKFVFTFNDLVRKVFHNRFLNKPLEVNEFFTQFFCNGKARILHETYYTNRTKVSCPKVITIHDMIYEMFNNGLDDEIQIIKQKKKAILEADLIIAVSENTKKDLLNLYPQVKDKTFVVHHGVSQSQYPHIKGLKRQKPFLLFVGNRGWYKNFKLLIDTFSQQQQLMNEFDLICFGGGSETLEETNLITSKKLTEKVFFLSGDDNLLISLYKSASSLVYISNYEGFGMPLLEAMALGCPVISSNTSSLPEVYGNAVISINPKEPQQLVEAFNSILFDSNLRSQLIEKGKLQASQFTWEKCAKETLSLYKKLI